MKGLQFSAGSIKELLVKQGLFPQEQPSAGQQHIPRVQSNADGDTSTSGSNPKLRQAIANAFVIESLHWRHR